MHEMISERAQQYPDKVAIDSWDGELTYREVDTYSSFLAASLQKLPNRVPQFIPICFEKSKWTIVAVLAVMKAGAAMVLMDPTLPLARLQNMREQVNATVMLSSWDQRDISSSIIGDGKVVVVGEESMKQLSSSYSEVPELPCVSASSLMYIIFTSGSTGTPKGVMISHRSYTSSAIPRAAAVGYSENLRVLDFASYAFDVSIDSMLLTLGSGGCLCIPSDEDRINDINGVMRRMRVSYAGITPSMARLLDPDVITGLSALGLGGEAASTRDVNNWGRETRIVIGYGPCECTIGCTINGDVATGRDYISIGPGNGAAMWIVDPNDHEILMPVGAVGELLVEGPIVGQGYLNDPEKTSAAFIHDPKWLTSGHSGYHGRRGRLYKTGDLGIFDPDGSGGIVFVGRKDTQVKLRGQRVELGEIESQLGSTLQSGISVVAEVIKPTSSGSQPTLVAFIAPSNATASGDIKIAPPDEQLDKALADANAELVKVLPRFMVPTAYVPVSHVPLLISGKVDRKKLREFGVGVDLRQQLEKSSVDDSQKLNELEDKLRQAWGTTLKKPVEDIGHKSDFFALGGDSLAAMKLVSVCRSLGLSISVGDIFASRTLTVMASTAVSCSQNSAYQEIEPFSMINQSADIARRDASQLCNTNATAIQDIYPCTPTQESLFTFSMKSEIPYVAQRIAKVPSHIDVENWKKAWEAVVAVSPILRTRVVQLDDQGFQQVVIEEGINWAHSTDLTEYIEEDQRNSMDFGQPLARYAIVDNQDGEKYMVWTIHHVVYDGFSEPLLLDKVRSALRGEALSTSTEMKHFSKHIQSIEADELQTFWKDELCDAIGPQFPPLPSRDYFPTPDGSAHRVISLTRGNKSSFTLATLIRGAWALVASEHIRSEDVVFGETLAGRDIALPGVEEICGPLVATVPVRIRIDSSQSISAFLEGVQSTMLNLAPYQHAGMQNIRKVSDDAQFACETGTGIVIQPTAGGSFEDLGFPRGDSVREALHFNPYPLMVAFGLGQDEIRVSTSFDSSLIEPAKMDRILAQLDTVLLQLGQDTSLALNQINHVSAIDLDQIWSWNKTPPMGTLGGPTNAHIGSKHPPALISWVCDACNPSLLKPIGCAGELCLEGNLLVGDTIRSPSWLLAGSPSHPGREGSVQLTGAIVEQQADGSIIYLGRKEDMLSTEGQASSFKQLQSHITRHLASFSAALVTHPTGGDKNDTSTGSGGIVFVEQPLCDEESVELIWMGHTIVSNTPDAFELKICPNITTRLALSLQKLEKSIKNAFPSRISSLTYIPVETLPHSSRGQDENVLLNQMAAKIPSHLLAQISVALRAWWASGASKESLTPAESTLQKAWSIILRRDATSIDVTDNFFRLGGDSVLAMKLVALLRSQRHRLTVADIFKNMRLGDAAKVLKTDSAQADNVESYKPFSLLDVPDAGRFMTSVVRPKLQGQQDSIVDVFPVTESQAVDVRATINPPRTSIQYTMLYFGEDVKKAALLDACNKLISSHEILRTVFIEHESKILQVVLTELHDAVETKSCGGEDLDVYVERLCAQDVETKFELGSSFFKIFHVQGDTGKSCLVIRLSHAQYDGVSLPALLHSLEALYSGKKQEVYQPFSHYMAQSAGPARDGAIKYWSNLLSGSSLSTLKETSKQVGQRGVFKHQQAVVKSLPKEVTTASFLAATWAVVLARRLETQDVTFGGITSGRGADFSDVDNIVGPCYQFTPIRVRFESQWTASDLMQHLQQQNAESAAHDFVGYGEIAANCSGGDGSWKEGFFNSVVHHQDWDDTDDMPFGEGSCHTAILNPHGDAPYPLKVVSFVRDDGLHLGIVGNEGDDEVVEELLSELVSTAEELARGEDLKIASSS